ncbi:hypothetical protein [Deinococcus marmoris]|uniref:Uncharacterized protein n=1 Tax=Deinococcus marmoris TaxID=249408 RepID=A0A1U7P4Q0_9DEIO|nr:hypothetical protein [Deinococcus marmoris]OLV20139.1 hypothetical protein BOO71_0000445 [Deinococcus marmoris]
MKDAKASEKARRLANQAHDHADFVAAIAHHVTHEASNNMLRHAATHLRQMAGFLESEYALEAPLSEQAARELSENVSHMRGAALKAKPEEEVDGD